MGSDVRRRGGSQVGTACPCYRSELEHGLFHRLKELNKRHPDIVCGCTSSGCDCRALTDREHHSRYRCMVRALDELTSTPGELQHDLDLLARRYDNTDMLARHILDPVTDHNGHKWCHALCEASTRPSAVRDGQLRGRL
jgi:hypothetical protein